MSVDITRAPYRQSGNVVRDNSTETRLLGNGVLLATVVWLNYFRTVVPFVHCSATELSHSMSKPL